MHFFKVTTCTIKMVARPSDVLIYPAEYFACDAGLQTAKKVNELPTFDSSCKVYANMLGRFLPGTHCLLQIFKVDAWYIA